MGEENNLSSADIIFSRIIQPMQRKVLKPNAFSSCHPPAEEGLIQQARGQSGLQDAPQTRSNIPQFINRESLMTSAHVPTFLSVPASARHTLTAHSLPRVTSTAYWLSAARRLGPAPEQNAHALQCPSASASRLLATAAQRRPESRDKGLLSRGTAAGRRAFRRPWPGKRSCMCRFSWRQWRERRRRGLCDRPGNDPSCLSLFREARRERGGSRGSAWRKGAGPGVSTPPPTWALLVSPGWPLRLRCSPNSWPPLSPQCSYILPLADSSPIFSLQILVSPPPPTPIPFPDSCVPPLAFSYPHPLYSGHLWSPTPSQAFPASFRPAALWPLLLQFASLPDHPQTFCPITTDHPPHLIIPLLPSFHQCAPTPTPILHGPFAPVTCFPVDLWSW